jgi:hypothetical protein
MDDVIDLCDSSQDGSQCSNQRSFEIPASRSKPAAAIVATADGRERELSQFSQDSQNSQNTQNSARYFNNDDGAQYGSVLYDEDGADDSDVDDDGFPPYSPSQFDDGASPPASPGATATTTTAATTANTATTTTTPTTPSASKRPPAPPPRAHEKTPLSQNSRYSTTDDDGDDELLRRPAFLSSYAIPDTKTPLTAAQAKALVKKKEKEEREAAARAAKEAKQNENKRKASEKVKAKEDKAAMKLQQQQDSGKFAAKEICVLLEDSLARSQVGADIKKGLAEMEYMTSDVVYAKEVMANVVRWCRREYMLGGATSEKVAGNEEMNILVVVFSKAEDFIHLLRKDNLASDDHPYLVKWVAALRKQTMKGQRIVVVLVNIEAALVRQYEASKNRRDSWCPTTIDEVQNVSMSFGARFFFLTCLLAYLLTFLFS